MSEWIVFIGSAGVLLFAGYIAGYSIGHKAGVAEGFRRGHASAARLQGRKSNV